MDDDEGLSRADRLRKLAKDEPKLGGKNLVDGLRKRRQLEQDADVAEAMDPAPKHRELALGNPMKHVGTMKHVR